MKSLYISAAKNGWTIRVEDGNFNEDYYVFEKFDDALSFISNFNFQKEVK